MIMWAFPVLVLIADSARYAAAVIMQATRT